MNPAHFEAFRPVCPVCRGTPADPGHPLRLGEVTRADGRLVVEGVLNCPNPDCLREYPVIDGVPVILPALRAYVAENILPILARADLTGLVEGIVGDCCGPGSAFDAVRHHLSSYTWDHYAEFDPAEPPDDPAPGAVMRLLCCGLGLIAGRPAGPALDLGCSVGRTTFELAAATGGLALGIDLNFAKLRLAQDLLRRGVVRYPRRRIGVVYDRREFPVPLADRDRVDFWACDAAALPLPAGQFGTVVSLNLLDSIHAPADHLRAAAGALAPGGRLIVGCPYDWAGAATAMEGWFGGHSQRGPTAGAAEPVLRALLTPGGPGAIPGVRIVAELGDVPWHVRLHDRSTVTYRVHLAVAEVARGPNPAPGRD